MSQNNKEDGAEGMSATEMFENEGTKPFSVKLKLVQKTIAISWQSTLLKAGQPGLLLQD
jgi:hypothetical protein